MIDTLSVAHESGYLHGLAVGVVLGVVGVFVLSLGVVAFFAAASVKAERPPLRVVRGGRR